MLSGMSSIRGESYTLDSTGEVVATGDGATANAPNEVLIKVTAGTALIGGASADALFPVTSDDGVIPINLTAGDDLYAKSTAGATFLLFRTKGN